MKRITIRILFIILQIALLGQLYAEGISEEELRNSMTKLMRAAEKKSPEVVGGF